MKTNILRWSLAITAITAVLSGCLKGEDGPPPEAQTYLSIMHLAITAPPVDVYFDNAKVSNSPFDPGIVTAQYNPVDKGVYSIRFKKASADSLVADVGQEQYDSLTYYTILLYNLLTDGPVRAIRIKDDYTEVASDLTKPYYRFFHTSPNTGPVDLYIDTIKIQSGRVHADNAANVNLNKFVGTLADVHKIEVREAGTSTVLASQDNVLLQAGHAYTFYLFGLTGGTGTKKLSLGILPEFK
jgi:hypothetical protein